MALGQAVRDELLGQYGHGLLWVPIALAIGIGLYFALPEEPAVTLLWALIAASAFCLLLGVRLSEPLRPMFWAVALVAFGTGWAGLRAHGVSAPVLPGAVEGPVEGRVIKVDRAASGALRVLLGEVVMPGFPDHRRPQRVRVALHGDMPGPQPEPGMRIALTARLYPPGGPVEPGGFDFRRTAWFNRLGAVGYTRDPIHVLTPPEPGLARWRYRLSRQIEARVGGVEGPFAAAIVTGDRLNLNPDGVEALRRANLAHLLAISGLHMGLLTAVVFWMIRAGLAAVPPVALRWPIRKWAAGGALLAGAGYLAVSGGAVATERAFVMVALALFALMIDRRALTLRTVALAAIVVLLRRPDALTGPGFQMSFAATAALVAVFAALRDRMPRGRVLGFVVPLLLSSLVAGLATAPFAAAHFNQTSHYGLLANMLCVPVMGAVVAPGAVLAAVLAPFGGAGLGLWVMKLGLSWILWVAGWVAALPGAVGHVPAPPGAVLPLLGLGAVVLVAWQGRGRWLGGAVVAAALAFWSTAERPPLLVAQSGGLMGLLTDAGRAVSRDKGDAFAVKLWAENDGLPLPQDAAAALPGIDRGKTVFRATLGGAEVLLVRGKTALAKVQGCDGAALLIATSPAGTRPCPTYDAARLARTGPLAIWPTENGLRIVPASHLSDDRLWSPAP